MCTYISNFSALYSLMTKQACLIEKDIVGDKSSDCSVNNDEIRLLNHNLNECQLGYN